MSQKLDGCQVQQQHALGSVFDGILLSRERGGFRLAKQTPWGDEYTGFGYSVEDAWQRLAVVTGRGVAELKALPLVRI